jgi:hypothetical protein
MAKLGCKRGASAELVEKGLRFYANGGYKERTLGFNIRFYWTGKKRTKEEDAEGFPGIS